MKKALLTVFLASTVFTSILAGISVVKADIVATNGLYLSYAPYILFPSNETYRSKVLALNVSFYALIGGNINFSMTYNLDGNDNETIDLVEHYFSMFQQPQNRSYIDSSVILPELSEGSHSLTVYLVCNYVTWNSSATNYQTYFDSQTVYFTIGDIAPTLTPTLSSSPNPSPSPSLSPTTTVTPSPSIPEFSSWSILVFVVAVSAFLVALKAKKAGARNHGII